jgi:hypothetical protein
MSAPVVPDRPRPWYRHPIGIAYLVVLAVVVTATFVVTVVPIGGPRADKTVLLMLLYGAVDVLMIVPLVLWAFGRRAFRLSRYPAVDLLLGIFLFAIAEAAVAILLFFTCLSVTRG